MFREGWSIAKVGYKRPEGAERWACVYCGGASRPRGAFSRFPSNKIILLQCRLPPWPKWGLEIAAGPPDPHTNPRRPWTSGLQPLLAWELPNKNFPVQSPGKPSQFSVFGIKFRPFILTVRYFWIPHEYSVNASFQDVIPSGATLHTARFISFF